MKKFLFLPALLLVPTPALASEYDLASMNLERLMDMNVTTVAKRTQSFSNAAAAIHTITREDIRRSGATSLPEVLKMAPGIEVSRISTSGWAVSARGFSSQWARQLLVLIDGRSIYTTLFSGVFWDQQMPPLDDIQRIEVIRGPGASLWGSNAMNGVINIITYDSEMTAGEKIVAGAGNEEKRFLRARKGIVGENYSARVNVQHRAIDDGVFRSGGGDSQDDYEARQIGVRLDFRPAPGQKAMLDGGFTETGRRMVFNVPEDLAPNVTPNGVLDSHSGYVMGNWLTELGGGDTLFLQYYHDVNRRVDSLYASDVTVDDYELQYNHAQTERHRVTWGASHRKIVDDFFGGFFLDAPYETDYYQQSTLFLQDEYNITPTLKATAGLKLEDGDVDRLQPQPSLRVAWHLSEDATWWAAASRATRWPARLQRTINSRGAAVDPVPALVEAFFPGKRPYIMIMGEEDFGSEIVHAYETGGRWQVRDDLFVDAAVYLQRYKDYLAFYLEPGLLQDPVYEDYVGVVLHCINGSRGDASGMELAITHDVTADWQLRTTYNHVNFVSTKNPPLQGAEQPTVEFEVQSPENQLAFNSRHDFSGDVEFDWTLRYVDEKFDGLIPAYTALDMRISKRLQPGLSLALVGKDLVDTPRVEFYQSNYGPPLTEFESSIFLQIDWQRDL